MKISVPIQRLDHALDIDLPFYATEQSAGMDLHAAIPCDIVLEPGKRCLVPTGIAIALPAGYEAQIRSRSGLSIKNGVIVLNSPGTIDADYRLIWGKSRLPLNAECALPKWSLPLLRK